MSLVWWLVLFVAAVLVFAVGAADLARESVWLVVQVVTLAAVPVLAIAMGVAALNRIRISPDRDGRGYAWAGIVLGVVGFIPSALYGAALYSDLHPGTVTVTGTAVYVGASKFDSEADVDGALCTPKAGAGFDHGHIAIYESGVFGSDLLYSGVVGSGTMVDGACRVDVAVSIPDHQPFIEVYIGTYCHPRNYWSEMDGSLVQTADGGLSFGSRNVLVC